MKSQRLLCALAVCLGAWPLPAQASDCEAACCTPASPHLQLTVVPEKYTECVPCKTVEVIKTTSRPIEYEVTRCRCVPVCYTDPCTGKTCTRYEQQTCVEKVKATVIDFQKEVRCVPAHTEEKTRNSFVITLSHEAAPCSCAPCAPAAARPH